MEVCDGVSKREIRLSVPWEGLHIPPMIWASEIDFRLGTVCLVLSSDAYNEDDYIRSWGEYLDILKSGAIQ